jgi:DNA-binding transcriptional regulator YiaG
MTPADLQSWRDRLGLSQAELGELLNVHEMTVSAWERGRQQPAPYLHLALERIEMQRTQKEAR